MRASTATSEQIAQDVANTSFSDRILCTAWYDWEQVTGPLEVSAYRFNWAADRRVQGQASLVIADPDGNLWPRKITDPLGCAGSRIRLSYEFGATGDIIPLGWWRIRRSDPRPAWQYRMVEGRHVWVPGGGTIAVQADEDLASLELDRLDIGARHPQLPPLLGEVARLASPYLTLETHPSVGSVVIPPSVEYDTNRLDAIQVLLDRVNATYRMGDGTLQVIPAVGTLSGWHVQPLDGGTLIAFANTMSDADLANAVTSWVETDDGELLTGRARLVDGPLRFGGPFGRVTVFRGANLATTQEQVDLDARTTLARIVRMGDVHLQLETLCHPGIQLGDLCTLDAPDYPRSRILTGRVHEVSWQGRDGVAGKTMAVTLAVPHDEWEQ